MSKDPAFLFYPGDWMGGTQWMTFEQKGCYMELLILQFNTGQFTEAQAKQVLGICFDVAWATIKQKFAQDGKFYYNERLREEIEKRRKFTQSRRDNASGSRTKEKPIEIKKASVKHMLKHMENENENINKDIDKDNKKEDGGELDKKLQLETRRAEFYRQVLAKKDYDQNMLIAFADYWAEANRSGTRMRFELEKTWELDRRLVTWDSRDKQFNRNPKEKGYHATDF